MSEREDQESQDHDAHGAEAQGGEAQGGEAQGADVQGVNLNPDDGKKSIEVDTHERLEHKAEAPDFDELPEEELEKERQQRLDPDNRPDNVEIDNSKRDFNPETGLFEDSEVDEPPEGAPFSTTESETSDSGSEDSKDSGDMDPMDATDEDAGDPKDRTEATDADQSKEAKESKDTES